jgi:hypothetical protein
MKFKNNINMALTVWIVVTSGEWAGLVTERGCKSRISGNWYFLILM